MREGLSSLLTRLAAWDIEDVRRPAKGRVRRAFLTLFGVRAMATTTEPRFACAACGKQYAWKPELAGKKGKCKCGATMDVPMSVEETSAAPAPAPASAP